MSQENVEVVRAVCAPWERGDFTSAEWAHPEIEFVVADGPTPGAGTGLAAMNDAWREALAATEGLHVEVEEYIPLEGDRVLVLMHNSGRAKASGLDLGQLGNRSANLFHIREGKVAKLVIYWDRQEALEALGLSE